MFILSDDFIKYHQITEKIVEDEDEIVNIHMNIIKVQMIFNLGRCEDANRGRRANYKCPRSRRRSI